MNKKVHQCQHCGNCCNKSTDLLGAATIDDIAMWITHRRFDILKWVDPIMSPSNEVVAFDIWIGPITHDDTSRCPWLRRKGENKYYCAIHDVKPRACREFPVNEKQGRDLRCPQYGGKLLRFSRKALDAPDADQD